MTAYKQRVLLMVAAALAAPCALAQPDLEVVSNDAETELIEQIREIEAREGPNSAESIGPLTALALIHQENGDHGRAVEVIELARGVVSVNYGLYSLEEAPLLRQLIRSEEARGNVAGAWDLEQELLALVARYPNDPRTVPVYSEIAGKRLDVLERYRRGEEFPPQIVLGCYYGRHSPEANCGAGSRRVVIAALRVETEYYYSRAISTAVRHEGYSGDELRALMTEVLPGAYRNRLNVDFGPVVGRILDDHAENPVSSIGRADTLIEVADWNALVMYRLDSRPLFTRGTSYPRDRDQQIVLELYERAYEELVKAGAKQASIDEIFAPRIPVVLPAFMPNPLASDETPESSESIDVAFDITKHGMAENIEILDTTANVTRRAERDLVSLIEDSRFRPRATNGQFAETSPVVVRYYLPEHPAETSF